MVDETIRADIDKENAIYLREKEEHKRRQDEYRLRLIYPSLSEVCHNQRTAALAPPY